MMDRAAWLAERRATVEATYDAEAPTYDDSPYATTSHAAFVDRLVATCPIDGLVLDAPCGTGQYFARVAAAGRRVVGVDQSAGMLAAARSKDIAVRLERMGLQELTADGEFDAVMTIDAMENISPEDWPLVVANLVRAGRPGGFLYLNVEEVDDRVLDQADATALARGWPSVRGEVIDGDTAGYHFYPGRTRILGWFDGAGLTIVDEAVDQEGGYGYRHFLLRSGQR
ncbi:MAG TPA: class I SAM-dependent methyltransferase [Candidatus Limnocylindrales bacterium]